MVGSIRIVSSNDSSHSVHFHCEIDVRGKSRKQVLLRGFQNRTLYVCFETDICTRIIWAGEVMVALGQIGFGWHFCAAV